MTHYLDLFSPQTYKAFCRSDQSISGFRKTHEKHAQRVQPGDRFICYMSKVSRWFGLLEVLSTSFVDERPIFYEVDDPFVVRLSVFSGSVYRTDCPEHRRYGGCGCREQRDEQIRCIEGALAGGAQHTGEHLLTVRTTARAIAAAAHFARDDGRAQRVLGAPVGGVEGRVEQKAEDGGEFDDEVLLKPSHGESATRRALQKLAQPLEVLPARDCQTVLGDHARVIAIAG